MIAETYYNEKMLPEIKAFHQELIKKIKSDKNIEDLYLGWKVWFSNIIDCPEILFIGINPGDEGGQLILEPDGELQYIYDQSPSWHLKNNTNEVFENLPNFDLQNCVKTNYYFLATKHSGDIKKIGDLLGRKNDKSGIGDKFFYFSKKWTCELINNIKPKLIICEGFEAFTLVTKYALDLKIAEPHNDVEKIFSSDLGINIICYKRNPGGAIHNKQMLIDVLSSL